MPSSGTTCYHVEADVSIITFPLRCMITLITTNIAFNIAFVMFLLHNNFNMFYYLHYKSSKEPEFTYKKSK